MHTKPDQHMFDVMDELRADLTEGPQPKLEQKADRRRVAFLELDILWLFIFVLYMKSLV